MILDRAADLCHLHEGDDALLHSCAARCRKADNRELICRGMLEQAGDLLTDNRTHGCHHKLGIHDEYRAGLAADLGGAADNGILLVGGGTRLVELLLIAREVEEILAGQTREQLGKAVLVAHEIDAVTRTETVRKAAVRADVGIFDEVVLGCLVFAFLALDLGGAADLLYNVHETHYSASLSTRAKENSALTASLPPTVPLPSQKKKGPLLRTILHSVS